MADAVTRTEFAALAAEVADLRTEVVDLRKHVNSHGDQLDEVRREIRALSSSVGRLTDLVTPLSLSLPRVERNVARLVEILEPRTVVVEGGRG